MTYKKGFFTAFFLIVCIFTSWNIASQVGADSTTPMSNSEITVNNSHNESEITVEKDSILIVKVLANPGTGYGWQIIKNDSEKLKPLGDSILEPLEEQTPGASENQVFRFLAQASGSTILELHYLRPWEKNIPPLKTYSLKVQIR